jgi:hypothetical protein
VRMSLTNEICLVMWATSASESARAAKSCSRSGLRCRGARIGVVLRARRLAKRKNHSNRESKGDKIDLLFDDWIILKGDFCPSWMWFVGT